MKTNPTSNRRKRSARSLSWRSHGNCATGRSSIRVATNLRHRARRCNPSGRAGRDAPHAASRHASRDCGDLHLERHMAGKTKRLAKAAVTLAATALVEKAIEKAVKDRRVRRKVAELGKAAGKQARTTGKAAGRKVGHLARTARKRAPGTRRAAARTIKKLVKAATR